MTSIPPSHLVQQIPNPDEKQQQKKNREEIFSIIAADLRENGSSDVAAL